MATRARFGRLPRSAPSLTATIVALAEEYQRVRDRNIEDAWKNGGLFEGRKVTDKMILAHWKDRRDSVSTDDPMWDYYNNLINGIEFTIDESSAYLKYKQGRISDSQMAAVYTKWAKKMPVDSENYRQLMIKAAQFRSAATARASGGRAGQSRDAYYNSQQRTADTYEAGWSIFSDFMMQVAVANNIIDPEDVDNPAGGWTSFNYERGGENDPALMANTLEYLLDNPQVAQQIAAQIRQYDPGFSGDFTEASVARLFSRASTGKTERYLRAVKAGDKTMAKAIIKERKALTISGYVARSTDFVQEDQQRKATIDIIINDPMIDPFTKADALDEYADWLETDGVRMATSALEPGSWVAGSPNFDPFAAGIVARVTGSINALRGTPTGGTTWDDPYATSTREQGPSSESNKVGTYASGLRGTVADVLAGKAVVVQADADGKPSASPVGYAILSPDELPEGTVFMPMSVPERLRGGNPPGLTRGFTSIAIAPRDVEVKVAATVDPNTGSPTGYLDAGGESPVVGKSITIQGPNGQAITLFGTYVAGELIWREANPVVEGVNYGLDTTDPDKITFVIDGSSGNVTSIDAAVDRNGIQQSGYRSPSAAYYMSNDAALSAFGTVNEDAFIASEMAYFRSNPTKDMVASPDPEAAAYAEAKKTHDALYVSRLYGRTPEQREQTYLGMRALAEARAKSSVAYDPYAELVSQVKDWRSKNVETIPGAVPTKRQKGPALPAGWTEEDLLTQPGMTIEEAQAYARYLTNNEVATAAPQELLGPPVPVKPRVVGTGGKAGGARVVPQKPTPMFTNPAAAPLSWPKPGTVPSRTVSPNTGFIVPTPNVAAIKPNPVPKSTKTVEQEKAELAKTGYKPVVLPGGEVGVKMGDRVAF